MRTTHLVVAASLAFAAVPVSRASADYSKAWTAAKAHLPANAKVVVALDVAAGVKTPAFAKAWPQIVARERDLQQMWTHFKSECKIEPLAAIDGLVLAVDPAREQGAVYLQLTGIDRAKLGACFPKVLKAVGEKVTVTQDGVFSVISDGKQPVYVAWPAPDVLAIGFDPDDKAKVQSWIDQKGAFAKAPITAQLAKVNMKAPGWGVFALDQPLDEDMPVKTGRGSVTFGKGTLALELVAAFDSAPAATGALAEMNREFAKELKQKSTPAELKKVLKAIVGKVAGADLIVTATLPEADLAAAITVLAH